METPGLSSWRGLSWSGAIRWLILGPRPSRSTRIPRGATVEPLHSLSTGERRKGARCPCIHCRDDHHVREIQFLSGARTDIRGLRAAGCQEGRVSIEEFLSQALCSPSGEGFGPRLLVAGTLHFAPVLRGFLSRGRRGPTGKESCQQDCRDCYRLRHSLGLASACWERPSGSMWTVQGQALQKWAAGI